MTDVFTVAEAAKKLKRDKRTVYEWLRKGQLYGVQISGGKFGHWLIPVSSLEQKLGVAVTGSDGTNAAHAAE